MSNESNQPIQKKFNQYQIQLTTDMDYINILIQNTNNSIIYESKFNLEYLHKFKLLIPNFTINEMIEFINNSIDEKNIKIEENEFNLKFILKSSIKSYSNVELILNTKNVMEKLINEIVGIKNENKILKNNYEIIKNKIELIEEENKNLKMRIDLIEKEKKDTINKSIENEEIKKLSMIEKEKEKEKEDLKNKIEKTNGINEIQNKNTNIILAGNDKNKITKCNLKNINSIQLHEDVITSASVFPSGNIISVSNDKSIIICDIHLNILQKIQNAHNDYINYIEVKDENNFITCSVDKCIKLWIKNENKFENNKIINNAHANSISKVIYYSNGNLISCSHDYKIKIWKENNNNNYESIITLKHSKIVCSILYLEDKNILISSGLDGTKFWNLNKNENNYNNIDCIKFFKEVECGWNGQLCRLDEDRIIVAKFSLKIISISKKIIIKDIDIPFKCWGIRLIKNKEIFLLGGWSKDIRVYRNKNYQCVQIIQNAHDDDILGFVELKDGSIASYSSDKKIKIWN